MPTRHVVLVTYGEPPTPSFVEQLTYSWRILVGLTRTVAPIPKPALPLIALSRAYGRRKLWRAEGYGSPLESLTRLQAGNLRRALEASSERSDWALHVAYEFRRPLLAEVMAGIPSDEPIWVVPMYAADSAFTHELSRQAAAAATRRRARRAPVRVLRAMDPEALAAISAGHVRQWMGVDTTSPETALVLAAHGTLLQPPRGIETGRADTERLCEAIRARLAPAFGLVVNGWLNHARGGRWTEPPIDEALQHVSRAGFSRLVYFPYGFLADNAESQIEGRLALDAHPSIEARIVPCLNESAGLARAIAGQILEDIIPKRDARTAAHSLSGMRLHHTRS